MFEKFTSEGSQDFRQRYQGTFGFFNHKGKKTLTQLKEIHANGRASYVEFVDRDDLSYKLNPDSEADDTGFEFLPPKCAWYNTPKGVPLLVSRIPAKQYLRGICDRNTSITTIRGSGMPVNFAQLIDIFEAKVSVAEAIKLKPIKDYSTHGGFALSPQFALSNHFGTIHCFGTSIGSFKLVDDVYQVELSTPELWATEIRDAFRRNNLKVELV